MKVERVTWVDSCAYQGWHKMADESYSVSECQTVGFVVCEDERCLALAPSVFMDAGSASDVMVIPKGVITKRKKLK